MKLTINISDVPNITASVNYDTVIERFRDMLGLGFEIAVVQEYNNRPDELLFTLRTLQQFNAWEEAHMPAIWQVQ